MTLDDIKKLNFIDIKETSDYIYISPKNGALIAVKDYPSNMIVRDYVKMVKQEVYSDIVRIDSSVNDASILDASI